MNISQSTEYGGLARQALARPLTPEEKALAAAMEAAFAKGLHDFSQVAGWLEQQCVARPSGSSQPWTVEAIERELAAINASLDAAYEGNAAPQPESRHGQ
jgi:hypothetical protein